MKSQLQAVAIALVVFSFMGISGSAAIAPLFSYQGVVKDSTGVPLEDVMVIFDMDIYENEIGGLSLWHEQISQFVEAGGVVILLCGQITPLPDDIFSESERWLEVSVNGEAQPRQRMTSVPYAFSAMRVTGDIETDLGGDMLLAGKIGNPPQLIIKDDPSVTPTVDEYLRMTDLKVSLIVDRGAGNVDWSALEADKLTVWHPTGEIGSRLDPNSLQLTSPDLPSLPPLPLAGNPFIVLADDVLNQLFASTTEAGKLKVSNVTAGTVGEFLPTELKFSTDGGATFATRLGNTGLEAHGGSVQLLDGCDLTVTGTLDLSGGTLDLGSSSLTVGGSLTVEGGGSFTNSGTLTFSGAGSQTMSLTDAGAHISYGSVTIDGGTTKSVALSETGLKVRDVSVDHVDMGTGGSGAGGGYLDLSGGSGGGRVRLSAAGTGDLRADGSSLTFEPAGGGPGARLTVESDELVLTDDVPTATALLSRAGGLTFALAGGSSAYYRADGVQLTGPDAARFGATSRAFSLTRPSNNGALVCTIDDAQDVFYCDLDDDGLRDVSCRYSPSKQLRVAPGTELRCEGSLVCESSSTYLGTCTCRSGWYCDANNDATTDVKCEALPTPEFSVAPGTSFACDGLATFDQSVQMNSNLTVNGALMVLGPKAFVQEHPEDPTKEIIYVALEGNESGTYTRGSAQLKNGVAEIQLPEDFHLVTNADGLTAQITPRGPVNSMLYVESVTPTTLVVKASNKKDENVKFDFMVNGVRAGFENHQVIRDKKSLAMNE